MVKKYNNLLKKVNLQNKFYTKQNYLIFFIITIKNKYSKIHP